MGRVLLGLDNNKDDEQVQKVIWFEEIVLDYRQFDTGYIAGVNDGIEWR